MKKAFQALRQYPKTLKAERQREKRREEMRKKVASIIPDFGLTWHNIFKNMNWNIAIYEDAVKDSG